MTQPNQLTSILPGLVANIAHALPPQKEHRTFDIVLDGGGFSGTHLLGALCYLDLLRETGKISIHRVAGVSIGAITALLFQARRLDIAFNNYPDILKHYSKHTNLAIVATQLKAIGDIIPTNFHATCNLHISYFDLRQVKHITVSQFTSNDHLLDVIRRSIHVPWLFDKSVLLRDKYIDGLYPHSFTLNPPMLDAASTSTLTTETLFMNLVNMPWSSMVCVRHRTSTCDSALEGALLVHRFFRSGSNNHFCHTFTPVSLRGAAFLARVAITHAIVNLLAWIYLGKGQCASRARGILERTLGHHHTALIRAFRYVTT